MPKSAKHKRERAADFKKAKLKLGKGKQVAQNATNTSIASKGIALPSQSLSTAGSKGSEPTSRRNLTTAELLIQCRHYSTPVKKQALQETLDLVSDHPYLIQKHLLPLTTALAHLVADPSAGVRTLVRQLVRKTAETLPRASFVQVCAPPIILFTLAALSSLEDPIRIDALQLVDTLLACIPDELVRGFDPAHIANGLESTSSEDGKTGVRILDSLLSLLKVRNNAPSTSSTMTSAKAATISDLSPEARLAVLSTLETFLAAAAAAAGDAQPRQEDDSDTAWYLAGALSTQEAFQDFLASHGARGASTSTTTRAMPIERYASLESPHENERFAIDSLGLFTPPATPTTSTTAASANPASLLALLHPTLLSSFLDSAPTALNPSTATASEGNSENQHLATVTAVVAVARQLFTLELGGASSANTTAKQRSEARKMLLAFLTHASPYFPFGADALAATTGASKRPSMAQQAEELKFLSLNLAFAELSSLLVLSGAQGKGDSLMAEDEDRSRKGKGKGKGKSRKEVDAERVEEVVLERVQEWVVQALRGELTTPSSPMGTTLSPSSFHSLTPTLWALLNQSDSTRSSEVFGAVVDYFTRQNTNATSDGRAGEGKRRAGEFIARCVLIHSSPSYTAPFDLSALALKLPSTLSPNAKDTKQNALARWLVALPKYLWELGGNGPSSSSPPREREIEVNLLRSATTDFNALWMSCQFDKKVGLYWRLTRANPLVQLVLSTLLELVQQGDKGLIPRASLESLSPLLIPFFHLVHPKTRAAHPGPFTRLAPTSSASRQALDLVWYLARPYADQNIGQASSGNVQGLVDAVERACAVVGGEAAERRQAPRVTV